MADRYDQERERYESGNRSEWGNRPETRGREGRNWSAARGREDWRDRREGEQDREYGAREGWRSNESQSGRYGRSERGSWEGSRQNEGRWGSDEGRSGYGYEPGRGEPNEAQWGGGRASSRDRWEDERGVSRQGGNWGETRNQRNYQGRGWNPGRDLSYREPMTGIHRGEWSSGHGAGLGLGTAENTEYSANYARSGSAFGGQDDLGGDAREYRERGGHAGRGPKGYKRSDDRIKEDVCERLTHDPHVDASEIEVQVKEGEVTLTGSVENRDQKRRAEDCIENLSGVREVNNQLRVQVGQPAMNPPAQSGGGKQAPGR